MGEVVEKCPLGLYITQTPCTINAIRRIFVARPLTHISLRTKGLGGSYNDD
jgi:hypothetical protein